ncbi:pyridoxamine 5'-phosphate oxidase family protein [Ornithinimicrobium murale]|uniref:pyridoxamine 5'-phosphate oxidase family protein n=1 Tax=Ornithinimicrobium murale TaxID=1050153 RepID=UPI000E0CC9FC|nr:pyridoxamine 5'-phosphate oxidase family protein [Ornithinimicrobium murale]
MNEQQITEILAKPYAQQLLNGTDPVRLAYDGLDGDPRVVPIGFWTEGDRVVMATTPNAPKVAALRAKPKVALTIDTNAFPPKVLLIRGAVELEIVDGVPEGYLEGGRRFMTAEQYVEWEVGVKGLYDEMVVIRVTPTWVKLLDFETTIPRAVEELVKAKASGS